VSPSSTSSSWSNHNSSSSSRVRTSRRNRLLRIRDAACLLPTHFPSLVHQKYHLTYIFHFQCTQQLSVSHTPVSNNQNLLTFNSPKTFF
jgi:hypothetical protein